jgi:4'-phosphopantetheinyl transferase
MDDAMPAIAAEIIVRRLDDTDLQDLEILSADERRRLSRITHDGARSRFLAGRNLLRRVLAGHLGMGGAAVPLRVLDDGRPSCDGVGCVSLSHSGEYVACALAECSMGIDVQKTDTGHDIAAIAASRFLPEELDWLREQEPDAFYRLWVLKEAWLKASGQGLAGGLDSIRVEIQGPVLQLTTRGSDPVAAALWRMPGAMLAVVVPGIENVHASVTAPGARLLASTKGWQSRS